MPAEFGDDPMKAMETLRVIEDDVASQIRLSHNRELTVVDAALDQIIQGLDAFASVKRRPDNPLESAQLFLAMRSFNSLRIASQSLERGYYQQALTLVRMSMEDQLIAEDSENHPPTLDALLHSKGRLGRGQLTFRKMAERISPKARKAWDEEYGDLSARAAHPRRQSLMGLTKLQSSGRITIRPGSNYDEAEVMSVLYYLLSQLVLVRRTVALITYGVGSNWTYGVGSNWIIDSQPAFDDVDVLWRQIDEWAGKQLSSK